MTDNIIKIENWCVVSDITPYTAPEAIYLRLNGEVFGHPQFPDGHIVSTSYIMSVDKNIVTTYTGNKYKLGKPLETFVQWCKDNGVHVPTENEPIKIRDEVV